MENQKDNPTIYTVMSKILAEIESTKEFSSTRATLANLRNSIGRDFSQSIEIWPIMFKYLPDQFLSKSGTVTKSERAILSSLQLYALYQQGVPSSVLMNQENKYRQNIGGSLQRLRNSTDTVAEDRRFNALITASSFEELIHHLRQMIQLLKSTTKTDGIVKIDFSKLATDLYFWQNDEHRERTKLQWAQSYYRIAKA
jgi:CRISPR system Cascade subunit CasB